MVSVRVFSGLKPGAAGGGFACSGDLGVTPSNPRKDVVRTALMLCLATAGLVAFILGLGDLRRQRNALAQLRWQALNYERRIGVGGALPLNFDPDVVPEGPRKMIKLECLDRESAARLRGSDRPIIVARTVPILRVFGRDGRAVMTFKGGKFTVGWMTLPRFDVLLAAQREFAQSRPPEPARDAPTQP